ncbi:hypothetical protein ACHHV8_15965 [Paenibacillus sp. TAB 01]
MRILLPWDSTVLNQSPWLLLASMAFTALLLSLITWLRAEKTNDK